MTPEVFDIDLYVDTKVSGDGNFVVNTDAVDAIHVAGGHAICYLDAGDAETYRPDYQRFVDFDDACDGCLIGNPFSQVFPDEFFLNINNDQGQRAFILKVNRDRVRKCAAAGFDGVEWDIIDTFEDSHSGFHISYRAQLMFNTRLANMAHHFGMSVAMKNDPSQVKDLLPYFDYAIVEECFQYHFCAGSPSPGEVAFVRRAKPCSRWSTGSRATSSARTRRRSGSTRSRRAATTRCSRRRITRVADTRAAFSHDRGLTPVDHQAPRRG